MATNLGTGKSFLFLKGPHGPFFGQLARMLRRTGAQCHRVGFNAGDRAFWRHRSSYIAFDQPLEDWPARLVQIVHTLGVTDLVLYGDTRPVHARAVEVARDLSLRLHVFEEGYLRPYWVTYERGGSNGNSRLMQLDLTRIRAGLGARPAVLPEAPDHWGDMREHIFYGALYHWFVMFANRRYRHFQPHRDIPVAREFQLYLNRLLLMPAHAASRIAATRAIKRSGFPYHLVLLQLEHDASFRAHSPLASMTEFIARVTKGFATGAPDHHHLVFKAHPLEDGRVPLAREIARLARENGLAGRVHFLRGGKLARLLDGAQSAVTVNSTAGQQALWRGLPLATFGAAIYAKPGLVSRQPIAEFFADPARPDVEAYRDFRHFLLATSQVAGGFYAARARRQLLRRVTDMMLHDLDPYDSLLVPAARAAAAGAAGTARDADAARRQQLRLVK